MSHAALAPAPVPLPVNKQNCPVDYLLKLTVSVFPADIKEPIHTEINMCALTEQDRLPGLWRTPKDREGWLVEHHFVDKKAIFGMPDFSPSEVYFHTPHGTENPHSEDDVALSVYVLPGYEKEACQRLHCMVARYLASQKQRLKARLASLERCIQKQ